MNRIVIFSLLILTTTSLCAQNKKLHKLFSKRKYQEVIAKANTELTKTPENIELNLLLARSYANSKEIEMALPVLKELNSNDQVNEEQKAWVEVYLAKCHFFHDRKQEAIELWRKCIEKKKNRDVVKYAKRYLNICQETSFFKDWKIVEGENIRFHFQDPESVAKADEYIKRYEKICKRMYQFFTYRFPKKIDVYVWKDKYEGYQKTGKPLSWSNSDLAIVNVYNNQEKDYEISHMISTYICKIKRKTMLINKGIGVYFDEMDSNLFRTARTQIPKDHFHIAELWKKTTEYKRDLSYPVGAAFVEFLINSSGKKKFKKFLQEQTIENGEVVYEDFDLKMKTFNALLKR